MTRCTAFCIPLFFGTVAQAADQPVVAVVGVHQPGVHPDDEKNASKALAKEIEDTGKATVLHGAAVGPTIAGRQQIILEEAILSAGRGMLASGKNLYNQAQPEEAVPILVEAIAQLEEGVSLSGDFRDLWDAHLILGTCHLSLEDVAEARLAFGQAIALNPVRSPDPARYPPDVIALFETVRSEEEAERGTLAVRSKEPLEIFLDGQPHGTTPTTIEGVYRGVHHLRGQAPGRVAMERIVFRDGPAQVELEPVAPSLGGAAKSEAGRVRQTTDLYRGFGRHTQGVDFVLLAGTDSSVLHLQLYDVGNDTFSKPTTVPFADEALDEARQMLPMLLTLLDDAGTLPKTSTQPSAVPLDRGSNPQLAALLTEPLEPTLDEPRKKRTGLWIGLGVGVLAVAGASTGLAVATSGPQYDGKITIGPLSRSLSR